MILGLQGYAEAGKSTVADILVDNYNFTQVDMSEPVHQALCILDPIVEAGYRYSEVVELLGYTAAKRIPEVRQLLQRMGTEVGRNLFWGDIWVEQAERRIEKLMEMGLSDIVVPNIRFANEVDMIRYFGGGIWTVVRDKVGKVLKHASENIPEAHPNDVIENNATVLDLEKRVDTALRRAGWFYT